MLICVEPNKTKYYVFPLFSFFIFLCLQSFFSLVDFQFPLSLLLREIFFFGLIGWLDITLLVWGMVTIEVNICVYRLSSVVAVEERFM